MFLNYQESAKIGGLNQSLDIFKKIRYNWGVLYLELICEFVQNR